MSIKYVDLELIDEIRDVIFEVKAGEVHLFSFDFKAGNPFDTGNKNVNLRYVQSLPFFSFKGGWDDNPENAGRDLDGLFKIKTAYPVVDLKEGLFAYINFSDEARVIEGVLKEFVYRLSSLAYLTVDITQDVPKSWSEIKVLFPEVLL